MTMLHGCYVLQTALCIQEMEATPTGFEAFGMAACVRFGSVTARLLTSEATP